MCQHERPVASVKLQAGDQLRRFVVLGDPRGTGAPLFGDCWALGVRL